MTPTPRLPTDDGLLPYVAQTVRDMQQSMNLGFANLASEIARLRDETVHRREFDRYRDELRLEITETQQRRDQQLTTLREDHEKGMAQLERQRRWRVTTAVAAFSALAAGVTSVADLISRLAH